MKAAPPTEVRAMTLMTDASRLILRTGRGARVNLMSSGLATEGSGLKREPPLLISTRSPCPGWVRRRVG